MQRRMKDSLNEMRQQPASTTRRQMPSSLDVVDSIGGFFSALAELAFPQNCVSCGAENPDALCDNCFNTLFTPHDAICMRCGRKRLTGITAEDCGMCHGKKYRFSEARSLFPYSGKARKLFLRTKFARNNLRALAKTIAHKSARVWTTHFKDVGFDFVGSSRFDMVVEVPVMRPMGLRERFEGVLSWKERPMAVNRRSFNFSRLFAQSIVRELNDLQNKHGRPPRIQWVYDVLLKVRDIPSQVGLSESERKRNVEDAFMINPKHSANLLKNAVLLIDDLMTTGATADECARVLKRAGASRVCVLTLFSTLPTPNLAGDYDEKVDFMDDLLVPPPSLV